MFLDTINQPNDIKNVEKEHLEELAQEAPLERNGTPEDVAKAVESLADAEFVTGQVLGVSGGFVM